MVSCVFAARNKSSTADCEVCEYVQARARCAGWCAYVYCRKERNNLLHDKAPQERAVCAIGTGADILGLRLGYYGNCFDDEFSVFT
jgi:hypothetical protein